MTLTDDDKVRAIRISQAIQEFFNKNPKTAVLRSTDAYDVLIKLKLVEADRHSGLRFRQFLHKLKSCNALDLIPQCRSQDVNDYRTNWFFESTPSKSYGSRHLKPVTLVTKTVTIDVEEVKKEIQAFPCRSTNHFTHIEIDTRKKYPRAYEYWTEKEEVLLVRVCKQITDSFELSRLFGKQPSAIQARLNDRFGIEI
jgi:hypothetical protein